VQQNGMEREHGRVRLRPTFLVAVSRLLARLHMRRPQLQIAVTEITRVIGVAKTNDALATEVEMTELSR
jgi:hypothetical protein